MALSRRHFSALAGAGLGALFLDPRTLAASPRRPRQGAETWFEWQRVADNAWAALGEGGNSLAVADGGQWVLVDTKNPGFARALQREGSAQSAGATLARVINTHHHADHTGGNEAFVGKVPVLAHAKASPRIAPQLDRYKERLKALPAQVARSDKPAAKQVLEDNAAQIDAIDALDAARFTPTESVDKDTELKIGARRIALHHFGAGHTDNDLVVHFPDLDVVHTGDLVFNGRHPFVDTSSGANSTGWIASLKGIIAICKPTTVVVPGHGAVTDVEGLRTQIRYFESARAAVQKAIDAGASSDKAAEAEILGFESLGSQGKSRVLGAIYNELTGATPK
jgi:cyclase